MMINSKSILALAVLASGVCAKKIAVISDFADPVQSKGAWQGTEGAQGVDAGVGYVRLGLPFASITDAQVQRGWWGMMWTGNYKVDLSQADRIRIKIRGGDPAAVNRVALAFRSGSGYYETTVDLGFAQDWRLVDLPLSGLISSGAVKGLDQIDKILISFSTAQKKDTWIEIGNLELHRGLEPQDAGHFGRFDDLAQLQAWLGDSASKVNAPAILERQSWAKTELDSIQGDTNSIDNQNHILMARHLLGEAFALGLAPAKTVEHRSIWSHYGHGTERSDGKVEPWSQSIPKIAAAGFNTVVPNFLWSGVASYPSKITPDSILNYPKKDYVREVLDLSKSYGLKVHAWKVMFQFAEGWMSPVGTKDKLVKDKNLVLQVNQQGQQMDWLSPCDSNTVEYEIAQLTEITRMYPELEGLALDYIRFSGTDVDFSGACRERFEKVRGQAVANWPSDVSSGSLSAEYAEFRRGLITDIVHRVHDSVKIINPQIILGAAVFSNAMTAKQWQLQDWSTWAKNKWVDQLYPMAYTTNALNFENMIQDEIATSFGVPVYPAIGAWINDVGNSAEQIAISRKFKTGGFGVFQMTEDFEQYHMPFIGNGPLSQGLSSTLPDTRKDYREKLPKEPNKGEILVAQNGLPTIIDAFDDGDATSELQTDWYLGADNFGTTQVQERWNVGEEGSSNRYAQIQGFMATQVGPKWPWAQFCIGLSKKASSADIRQFESVAFRARGDGQAYTVGLNKESVTDYANFKAEFKTGANWKTYTLPLKLFAQPNWGKQVPAIHSDVQQICLYPSGSVSNKDFHLDIDDLQLLPPSTKPNVAVLGQNDKIFVRYQDNVIIVANGFQARIYDLQGNQIDQQHWRNLPSGLYQAHILGEYQSFVQTISVF